MPKPDQVIVPADQIEKIPEFIRYLLQLFLHLRVIRRGQLFPMGWNLQLRL